MITYEKITDANAKIKTTPIKGKNYAEVNERIKAFRSVCPNGCIETALLSNDGGVCVFMAIVKDKNGKVLGMGHAYEKEGSNNINRTSYIENCETSAVGRALGMCGFGIDTSVASYEEVANAIQQQEERPTETHLSALFILAERKGVTTAQLLKKYKVKALSEMSMSDYTACVKGLESMNDI